MYAFSLVIDEGIFCNNVFNNMYACSVFMVRTSNIMCVCSVLMIKM